MDVTYYVSCVCICCYMCVDIYRCEFVRVSVVNVGGDNNSVKFLEVLPWSEKFDHTGDVQFVQRVFST